MRLTTHDKGRQPYVITANERTWREIYDKLAAYEDTGYEPEEIDFCLSGAISPQEAKERYEANKKRYDEWLAWKQAEEQGRLVMLPCKVGDTVWTFRDENDELVVAEARVQGISISANNKDVILHFGGYPFSNAYAEMIGKTVFLTREDAEAALKGETKDV